jgi:hypothetical protein
MSEPDPADVAAIQAAAQKAAGVLIMPDGTVQDLQSAQLGQPAPVPPDQGGQ